MPSYSEERKQQILNKLLPPSNMTVAEVSRQEGIGVQTLYNWRDKAKQQGRPVPGSKPTSEHWSAEATFATVLETASLNEAELSEYCRAKGLYVDQVKAWKADASGNLVYRKTARNFAPIMAMAAKVTIAQVTEVVELGQLDPENIITPGIFVQRIVQTKEAQQ